MNVRTMIYNCNTDDRIYDTNTGWQADPGTGLNLIHGKTADTPVDDNRITTLKQDAESRYDTDTVTSHTRPAAKQRAIDRLKRRAKDQPDIPKVAAAKDASLDQFTETEDDAA